MNPVRVSSITRTLRMIALFSSCSLAMTACTDPDERVDGVFVLESIAGQPLPFTYRTSGGFLRDSAEVRVLADTIELRSDGGGERRTLETQRVLPDGGEVAFPSFITFRHRCSSGQVALAARRWELGRTTQPAVSAMSLACSPGTSRVTVSHTISRSMPM